ncbi:MAG TPA: nitrite/sulfite reductase [Anaerohalosphaeraceae bacterium]|nr:nitrite/sulfite reductase [Anaerohalosphaeraceae bacterium]
MGQPYSQENNRLPQEPQRLWGTYPQKQEGLWMQRLPILGGRITWQQWRAVAELAERFTPDTPLHLTIRQDIELHNVRQTDVPALYEELDRAGLCPYGACGDSIRNITVSPGCDLHPDDFDLLPAARLLHQGLNEQTAGRMLPRKFKISLCGLCDNRGAPYLSDLGFLVQPDGTFRVIGAGSLGPIPRTGMDLYEQVPAEAVLPLAAAALEMFIELGERNNRSRARLRHVRERLGDEPFRKELDRRFQTLFRRQSWPSMPLPRGRSGYRRLYTLQPPRGDLPARAALELARAAQSAGAVLRITLSHSQELYGDVPFPLPASLKPFADLPCVVACPGADSCPRALADAKKIGIQIQQTAVLRSARRQVAVSGCPNGCAQSAAADIGLIGRRKTLNGWQQECFDVYLNGGQGQSSLLGQKTETVPSDQIESWLRNYLEQTQTSERVIRLSGPAATPDARPARGSGG